MATNPNAPRPKHTRYLNSSQFRVHEPVGMLTPVRQMKTIPSVFRVSKPSMKVIGAPTVKGPALRASGHAHHPGTKSYGGK